MASELILYSWKSKNAFFFSVCDLSKQILKKCDADLLVSNSLTGAFAFPMIEINETSCKYTYIGRGRLRLYNKL